MFRAFAFRLPSFQQLETDLDHSHLQRRHRPKQLSPTASARLSPTTVWPPSPSFSFSPSPCAQPLPYGTPSWFPLYGVTALAVARQLYCSARSALPSIRALTTPSPGCRRLLIAPLLGERSRRAHPRWSPVHLTDLPLPLPLCYSESTLSPCIEMRNEPREKSRLSR
jgi:hypothetical protein